VSTGISLLTAVLALLPLFFPTLSFFHHHVRVALTVFIRYSPFNTAMAVQCYTLALPGSRTGEKGVVIQPLYSLRAALYLPHNRRLSGRSACRRSARPIVSFAGAGNGIIVL